MSETIERIDRPSPATFVREFVARGRPAIITGVADDWKARQLWSPEYLRSSFGSAPVRFEVWDGETEAADPADYLSRIRKQKATLGSFIDLVLATEGPSRKNYLAQYPVFRLVPQLRDHISSLEPYMGIPGFYPERVRARLQKEPTMWLGPEGVVSTLHFDSSHNFFVQLYGHKRFVLVPPEDSRRVYYPCYGFEMLHFSPVDVERPDPARFPLFEGARRLEFTVGPGEILFIPVRWWHHVRSLDTSISLNFWWNSVTTYLKIGGHLSRHYGRRLFRELSRRGPVPPKRQAT